jgi:hypothetical protein
MMDITEDETIPAFGAGPTTPNEPTPDCRNDLVATAAPVAPLDDLGTLSSVEGRPTDLPLLVPAEQAFAAIGIGRTKGFELIRNGHLIARKLGSRTLVETESLRTFVATLPRAGGNR